MPLSRWWYILQNHRTSQLIWRAASIAQRRLFPLLPHSRYTDVDPSTVVRRENDGFAVMLDRHLQLRQGPCSETASRVMNGEFEFLNECRRLSRPIDWQLASVEPVSHLWRFHLHYHEYLLDLLHASRTGHDDAFVSRVWEIVEDWITSNPLERPGSLTDAWHPFCLSKRIGVWLLLWQAGEPPDHLQDRFACSLESQIRYLERHLEWDLRGNHLLENLRTLALAGAFFDGPIAERRLVTAGRLIRAQLSEQVLPSGEHFERSPMYHAQMLNAVLDIRDAATSIQPELAGTCEDVVCRMASFLSTILHPDGKIPLLSDSALGETPHPSVLIAAASSMCESSSVTPPPVGDERDDYWVWRNGSDFLLFDAGPVGADELPAHAHCDLLTLEASVDGRRLFVDRGVYDYGDGEMRESCRSSSGHNVLQIDGVEQCDMWSRFRLGYRGHPSSLKQGQNGPFAWCSATHNAYRRISVPVVGRWIGCRPGLTWLCIDWANGTGTHELVSRLHLAPEIEVSLETPGSARLLVGERTLSLTSLTQAEMSIDSGWYCPDFGVRHENSVLIVKGLCSLPGLVGWSLQDVDSRDEVWIEDLPEASGIIRWRDGEHEIAWMIGPDGVLSVEASSQDEVIGQGRD